MLEVFNKYYDTARALLKYRNKEAYELFIAENISERFDNHDNWDGGLDSYTIFVQVPTEKYIQLQNHDNKSIENDITTALNEASQEDESIQLNGTRFIPHENASIIERRINEEMWEIGLFRLFISHVSTHKVSATNLKVCLRDWFIDCFVAHEDIKPTKEWEIEIEGALFSMDALCAILTPDFNKSSWCDQEVGIAIGQNKLCIPISKGAMPYGFLGKVQAMLSNGKSAKDVAQRVAGIIYEDSRTHSIYCRKLSALLLNAKSKDSALMLLGVISSFSSWDKIFIEMIHKDYTQNSILMIPEVLTKAEELFKSYGLPSLSFYTPSYNVLDTEDLPF